MPSAKIPFAPNQRSGFDPLSGASPIAMNIVMDATGTITRRPGLQASSLLFEDGLGAEVQGLYITTRGEAYGVAGDSVYKITPTGARELSGTLMANRLLGSGRPIFAETEAMLVMARGNIISRYIWDAEKITRLSSSAPLATHVIANNSRLLANDVENKSLIHWSSTASGSATAGHEEWTLGIGTAGYLSSEGKPDPVPAIGENLNEVFSFGTTSLQCYSADAQYVYTPTVSHEYGTGAPYSIVKHNESFLWLDQQTRFIASDGRSREIISDPVDVSLEALTTPGDCFGYWVSVGNTDAVVWTFPTDQKTFAYYPGVGWSQWSGFSLGNWTHFPVTAAYQSPIGGRMLCGTSDGELGEFSEDALSDFGGTVRAYVETGFQNHDTDSRKHCKCVRFVLKRGATGVLGPHARFGFRDKPGAWEATIDIDLGVYGDSHCVVEFRSLGVYRRRDWFFEFSGTEKLVLVSAEEEFDILEQ